MLRRLFPDQPARPPVTSDMPHIVSRALATALLICAPPAGGASAQAPRFDFPADCTIGYDCWYRAYVDLDTGAAYRDHRCGVRSYEGHQGTDVAPFGPGDPPFRVLAAAAGVVVGVRDGLDDRPLRDDENDSSRRGAECGNGVRIDHGGGWTTQYCHLRRNSVTVGRGARVQAGDALGAVGASGQADAPHLHFQVERDGAPVDPFIGAAASRPPRCDAAGTLAGTLWRDPAQQGLAAYEPIVVYRAGVATGRPDPARVRYEGYPTEAPVSAGALVGYVVLLGATGGTTIDTVISGPDGARIFENRADVPRDFARYFTFAGTPRPRSGWAPGVYRTRFVVSAPDGGFRTETTARIVLR